MNVNLNNKITSFVLNSIQHYNHDKYWKMRNEVTNPNSKVIKFRKLFYLLKIKKMDAYNNASMGTDLNKGAYFKEPPYLPHGLNGIIIYPKTVIGSNCTIFQQVTIAGKDSKAAIIGDNCVIGAGAKIIGEVNIGNNVTIGANAVVVKDVPDGSTVAGVPAKIIKSMFVY